MQMALKEVDAMGSLTLCAYTGRVMENLSAEAQWSWARRNFLTAWTYTWETELGLWFKRFPSLKSSWTGTHPGLVLRCLLPNAPGRMSSQGRGKSKGCAWGSLRAATQAWNKVGGAKLPFIDEMLSNIHGSRAAVRKRKLYSAKHHIQIEWMGLGSALQTCPFEPLHPSLFRLPASASRQVTEKKRVEDRTTYHAHLG